MPEQCAGATAHRLGRSRNPISVKQSIVVQGHQANSHAATPQSCWLCGSTHVGRQHAWPDFQVLRCSDCGLGFVDLSRWSYPYSDADYYDPSNTEHLVPNRPHLLRRMRDVRMYVNHGRVLDIGCGMGEFAVLMRQAGFDVEAIDESKNAIGALRRQHPEIQWHCGNLLEYTDRLGRFDVITMYHVLEHIPTPLSAMQAIRRLLAPGGLLVLEVPNAQGLHARLKGRHWQYFERHHVNYFGRRHLETLAKKLGLTTLNTSGFYHLSYPQGVWWKDLVKGTLAALGFEDVISIMMRAP